MKSDRQSIKGREFARITLDLRESYESMVDSH